jgi:hypothetical protein
MIIILLNNDRTVHSVHQDGDEKVYVAHRQLNFREDVDTHKQPFRVMDDWARQIRAAPIDTSPPTW